MSHLTVVGRVELEDESNVFFGWMDDMLMTMNSVCAFSDIDYMCELALMTIHLLYLARTKREKLPECAGPLCL